MEECNCEIHAFLLNIADTLVANNEPSFGEIRYSGQKKKGENSAGFKSARPSIPLDYSLRTLPPLDCQLSGAAHKIRQLASSHTVATEYDDKNWSKDEFIDIGAYCNVSDNEKCDEGNTGGDNADGDGLFTKKLLMAGWNGEVIGPICRAWKLILLRAKFCLLISSPHLTTKGLRATVSSNSIKCLKLYSPTWHESLLRFDLRLFIQSIAEKFLQNHLEKSFNHNKITLVLVFLAQKLEEIALRLSYNTLPNICSPSRALLLNVGHERLQMSHIDEHPQDQHHGNNSAILSKPSSSSPSSPQHPSSMKLPWSVRVRAPARIDLAGGWSDTPPITYRCRDQHPRIEPAVLNVAVRIDGKKPIECRCTWLAHFAGIYIRQYDDTKTPTTTSAIQATPFITPIAATAAVKMTYPNSATLIVGSNGDNDNGIRLRRFERGHGRNNTDKQKKVICFAAARDVMANSARPSQPGSLLCAVVLASGLISRCPSRRQTALTSKTTTIIAMDDCQQPSAAYRFSFPEKGFQQRPRGIFIETLSTLPHGSGLGTSSILSGAVLAAIWRLQGRPYTDGELVHTVLVVEQLHTTGGGWQDQIGGCVPGGFKLGRLVLRADHSEALKIDKNNNKNDEDSDDSNSDGCCWRVVELPPAAAAMPLTPEFGEVPSPPQQQKQKSGGSVPAPRSAHAGASSTGNDNPNPGDGNAGPVGIGVGDYPPLTVEKLEQRLVLVYTGLTRLAKNLLQKVVLEWLRSDERIVQALKTLTDDARQSSRLLEQGKFPVEQCERYNELKRLFTGRSDDGTPSIQSRSLRREKCQQKQLLFGGSEIPAVAALRARLRRSGVAETSWMAGAGGGGFLCVWLAPDRTAADVSAELQQYNQQRQNQHRSTANKSAAANSSSSDADDQEGMLSIHSVQIDFDPMEITTVPAVDGGSGD